MLETGNCSIVWPTEPIRGYKASPGEVTHVTAVFLGPVQQLRNRRYTQHYIEQLMRSHSLNRDPGYVDILDYRTVGYRNFVAFDMCPNKLAKLRADMVFWLSCVGLEPTGDWEWEPHVTLKSARSSKNMPPLPARLKLGKPIVWWK